MEKFKNIFKKIIDLLEKFLTAFLGFFEQLFNNKQNKDENIKIEGKNLEAININNDKKTSDDNAGFNEEPNTFTKEQLEQLIKDVIKEELELEQITEEEAEFINTLTAEILPLVNNIKEEELKEVIKKNAREKLDKRLNMEINNPTTPKIITPLIIKKNEKLETSIKDTFLESKKTILKPKEVKEDIIVDMPFINIIGTIPPMNLGLEKIENGQPIIEDLFAEESPFISPNIEDSNTKSNFLENDTFIYKENVANNNPNIDTTNNLDFKKIDNTENNLDSDISIVNKTMINNDLDSITNKESLKDIVDINTQIEDDKKKDL